MTAWSCQYTLVVFLPCNKLKIKYSIVNLFHTKTTTYHLSLNSELKTVKPCFNFVKHAFFFFRTPFSLYFYLKIRRMTVHDTCQSNSLGICVARGVTRADAYARTQKTDLDRGREVWVEDVVVLLTKTDQSVSW